MPFITFDSPLTIHLLGTWSDNETHEKKMIENEDRKNARSFHLILVFFFATVVVIGTTSSVLMDNAMHREFSRLMSQQGGTYFVPTSLLGECKLVQLGPTPLVGPDNPPAEDDWTHELLLRLDRIRANCGALCIIDSEQALDRYNVPAHDPDAVTLPRQLQIPIDCDAIMLDEEVNVGDPSIPCQPPDVWIPYYTLNGLIPFSTDRWIQQAYMGSSAGEPVWSINLMNRIIRKINNN